jgi:tRNA pseudouridine13 synthase
MIKVLDEDFIVEENADISFQDNGEFGVYLLEKRNWNTLDLLKRISKILKIPISSISYGGKKDKHGITFQFITIKDKRELSAEGKDFSLKFVGRSPRPMGPDLILSNSFKITLRNIKKPENFYSNLEEIRKFGVPNFFDDQRFRSFDPRRGFFGEKIVKKQWNGALQVFLTSIYPDMKGEEKRRREEIFKNWKNWEKCLEIAERNLEKKIFKILRDEENPAKALHLIPKEEVSMQYSSFQSHIWNEVLRRLIKIKVKEIFEVKGIEGPYLFWKELDDETFSYFKDLKIPTPSAKMKFNEKIIEDLFEEVLREKGIKRSNFRTSVLRKVYFRSFERKALLIPEDLKVLEEGDDELNKGRKKIKIEFSLPRGSYATIITKRLEVEWKKN